MPSIFSQSLLTHSILCLYDNCVLGKHLSQVTNKNTLVEQQGGMMKDLAKGLGHLGIVAAMFNAAPILAEATTVDLEEVIVTATRRSVNLQDTSAAISSMSKDDLERRSIDDIAAIAEAIPGLNIASYQGDSSIFIRGIGTPTIIAGSDSSTATYVDGVYYSRAAAINPAFFDLERIEVLRGPQGTLYGRNATGGAVNLISRKPGDTWQYDVGVAIGDYQERKLEFAAGGPISDNIGVRLAIQHRRHDGYTTLVRPDQSTEEVEDRDEINLKAQILWDISDAMSFRLIGDHYRADDKAAVFHFASTGYAEEVPNWYTSREGLQTGAYFAYRAPGRVSEAASRTLFSDVPYQNQSDIYGLTARFEWSMPNADLSVTANRKTTNPRLQNEFDSSDAFVNLYQREEDHWQKSIEVQLASNGSERLSWIVGATYFEEDNDITNNIFGDFWEPILRQGFADLQTAGVLPAFPIVIPETDQCCTLQLNGEQQTEAWAVYFDLSYELSEAIRLHFGGRQASEERDGRQQFQLLFAGQTFAPNAVFFPTAITAGRNATPDPFGFVLSGVSGPETFEDFTPKFGIDYRQNEDILWYFTAQKGFKTGGYNIGSSQLTPFKPEKIWSYEVGVKSEWNTVRLNAAAFHYQYENLQAQDSIGNQPIIRNVGESEVSGIEFEVLAQLSENWQVDGHLTYLSAEFTDGQLTEPLRPAPATQEPGTLVRDLDGLKLTRAPKWQGGLGIQYQREIPGGGLLVRADYAYQSEIFFTVFNIDAAAQDSYGVVNLRAQFEPADKPWRVSLYGRNLGDKTYFGNQILTGTVYGAEFVGSLAPPRTWGLELNVSL